MAKIGRTFWVSIASKRGIIFIYYLPEFFWQDERFSNDISLEQTQYNWDRNGNLKHW